jgi:hypothetical protein
MLNNLSLRWNWWRMTDSYAAFTCLLPSLMKPLCTSKNWKQEYQKRIIGVHLMLDRVNVCVESRREGCVENSIPLQGSFERRFLLCRPKHKCAGLTYSHVPYLYLDCWLAHTHRIMSIVQHWRKNWWIERVNECCPAVVYEVAGNILCRCWFGNWSN